MSIPGGLISSVAPDDLHPGDTLHQAQGEIGRRQVGITQAHLLQSLGQEGGLEHPHPFIIIAAERERLVADCPVGPNGVFSVPCDIVNVEAQVNRLGSLVDVQHPDFPLKQAQQHVVR